MSFKTWWKKRKLWLKGLISGTIIGLAIYFLSFSFPDTEFSRSISSVGPIQFCKILNIGLGEDCAFVYTIYGWLFLMLLYGVIGFILGFILEKIRK